MTILTKEECLKALDMIRDGRGHESFNYGLLNAYGIISCLINEHFELKEIIKKHGLENLTLHELDCAFRKMLSYVEENNRLMNFLSQQNKIIKEYQNGEAYKELKRSFDELLGHAVAFQEELINLKDNQPLKFEELHENMWVWDNRVKAYLKIRKVFRKKGLIWFYTDGISILEIDYKENLFYRHEVKENE